MKVVPRQHKFHLLLLVGYRRGRRNDPWAVKTKLGWTLSGPLPKHKIAQIATTFLASDQNQLAEQLKTWWSSESYPSRCNVSGRSREVKKAIELLEKTTKLWEGKYEVGLPWLDDQKIPNNYYSDLYAPVLTGTEATEGL